MNAARTIALAAVVMFSLNAACALAATPVSVATTQQSLVKSPLVAPAGKTGQLAISNEPVYTGNPLAISNEPVYKANPLFISNEPVF